MSNVSSGGEGKVRSRGALTLGVLAALVAATGVPDAENLAKLMQWGVPESVARIGMYVAPVIVIVAAILIGRAVAKGRSAGVRWALYAGFGAVSGFFLAMCLEVFAGVPVLLERVTGPLAEPGLLDILLWSIGGFGLMLGLMQAAISAFGPPGMAAIQVEDMDPEALDVRKAERQAHAWSALGMFTLGLGCAALAVARQAGADGRLVPVIVALLAGALSAIASYVLWRGFDELQRRQVVNGYAISAVIVTLGAFVWAALQALQLVPALDASGVFLVLILVQTVAVVYATAASASGKAMQGVSA